MEQNQDNTIDKILLKQFEEEIWNKVPHLENNEEGAKIVNATPLVDITEDFKECAKEIYKLDLSNSELQVYGKLDSTLLTGSIKVRPAANIIHDAIMTGKIKSGQTVIEATSGNFGIALGITVDNAILFLAKYRQELKANQHDMNYAILKSLRETGLGIFYTSVILFFGFIMFVFSQFGGTKALGLLVSITILVGMVTNLIVLPSLLLTLQKRVMSKSFEEPFFEIFDEEEDYDTEKLQIEVSKALGDNS